jgi:hypothetical protein
VILSFVQSPHIGDDPEHFILLRAAAMERLHRATDRTIDNSKYPRVRQHLFVEHVLAGYRGTHLAGAISTVTDDAVGCVEFLAIGDRVGIAATAVAPVSLNFLTAGVSTSPD